MAVDGHEDNFTKIIYQSYLSRLHALIAEEPAVKSKANRWETILAVGTLITYILHCEA